MGRLYITSVLMTISRQQPAKVAETELAPITPGAWAAWATRQTADLAAPIAASQPTVQPAATPVTTKLQATASRA